MNIPQPGEHVEIVHGGDQLPRQAQIQLVTEEGVFHLGVHQSDENTIELRVYEGMRPDQS